MKRFADVEFTNPNNNAEVIAQGLVAFVRTSKDWNFLDEASAQYSHAVAGPALMAESAIDAESGIAVAIAERHGKLGKLEILNVVPSKGQLSVEQYNGVAKRFVLGFRRYSRQHHLPVFAQYSVPTPPTSLHQIIRGNRTRRLFEHWLFPGSIWGTPTISHPNDIDRLDDFICAYIDSAQGLIMRH